MSKECKEREIKKDFQDLYSRPHSLAFVSFKKPSLSFSDCTSDYCPNELDFMMMSPRVNIIGEEVRKMERKNQDDPQYYRLREQKHSVELHDPNSCKNVMNRPYCDSILETANNGVRVKTTNYDMKGYNKEATQQTSVQLISDKASTSQRSMQSKDEIMLKRVGRKPENLGLLKPKYIVLKEVARSLKKVLKKDIESSCQPKKRHCENPLVFEQNLGEYITKRMQFECSSSMLFLVGAFINPKLVESLLVNKNSKLYSADQKEVMRLKRKLKDTKSSFESFSQAKLKAMCSDGEVCKILRYSKSLLEIQDMSADHAKGLDLIFKLLS